MSAINEHNLISKLSYLVFGSADAIDLSQLKQEMINENKSLAKQRIQHPGTGLIEKWFAGRPIGKWAHFKFVRDFVETLFTTNIQYEDLPSERKKVYNQINKFIDSKISLLGDDYVEASEKAGLYQRSSLLHIHLLTDSLQRQITTEIEALEAHHPNSDASIEINTKSIEFLQLIESGLNELDIHVEHALFAANDGPEDLSELISGINSEFRVWLLRNKPELVDVVMRLGPASAFIGILGVAGANMAWATPMVLALCGGKKITHLLKEIKIN